MKAGSGNPIQMFPFPFTDKGVCSPSDKLVLKVRILFGIGILFWDSITEVETNIFLKASTVNINALLWGEETKSDSVARRALNL